MEGTQNNYKYIISLVVLLSTWLFSTKLLLTTILGYYTYNKPTKRVQYGFLFMASWTLFGLLNTLFYVLAIVLYECVNNKELVNNILQQLQEDESNNYLGKTYKNVMISFDGFKKMIGIKMEKNNLYNKYTTLIKQLGKFDSKVGFSNRLTQINGYLDNFFNTISNQFSKVEQKQTEKVLNRVRNNNQEDFESFFSEMDLKHIGPENSGPPTKKNLNNLVIC